MADRGYIDWKPQRKTLTKLENVKAVLETYDAQLPMTVRQIFYVLVGRGLMAKTKNEYDNLAYVLRCARRAKRINFDHIHDQGSILPYSLVGNVDESDLYNILRATVRHFKIDPQLYQRSRTVLWCEAAGMVNQLRMVADQYGVPVISGGGFDSLTDKYNFARLVGGDDRPISVLHIGDLDRQGESMFDVLSEDVAAFVEDDGGDVTFHRLAVTRDQVVDLQLPVAFDSNNVQAEAIPPDVLARLVRDAIRAGMDMDLLQQARDLEDEIRSGAKAKMEHAGLW